MGRYYNDTIIHSDALIDNRNNKSKLGTPYVDYKRAFWNKKFKLGAYRIFLLFLLSFDWSVRTNKNWEEGHNDQTAIGDHHAFCRCRDLRCSVNRLGNCLNDLLFDRLLKLTQMIFIFQVLPRYLENFIFFLPICYQSWWSTFFSFSNF